LRGLGDTKGDISANRRGCSARLAEHERENVVLRVSPGHMSALLSELESLGLVKAVRARGRHRQAFRITPDGTAAVHNHYERVTFDASSAEADHRQRALRWLLNGT
jgi:DNA-binding PadR family transcriptional regulator